MLFELFAALGLGLEGEGTSEERAVRLNNVNPEDFEMLVHHYNDFQLVILSCPLAFNELTRWAGHEGFLSVLPPFNIGKD